MAIIIFLIKPQILTHNNPTTQPPDMHPKDIFGLLMCVIVMSGYFYLFIRDAFRASKFGTHTQKTNRQHQGLKNLFTASTEDNTTLPSTPTKTSRLDSMMRIRYIDGQIHPDLRVMVLTMNREDELSRLLDSLNRAEYGGDRIDLDIWIDRLPSGGVHLGVLNVSDTLKWSHGTKTVHVQEQNVGIYEQWTRVWHRSIPGGLDETAKEIPLILEEDMEVSRFFWRWLKKAQSALSNRDDIAGVTLQRASYCAKFCPSMQGGPVNDGVPFLYQAIGTWGYSPVARSWVRFVEWLDTFKETKKPPYVDGLLATEVYKNLEKSGECPGKRCPWSLFHARYTSEHRDSKTLYIKPPTGRAFAVHQGRAGMRLVEGWDEAFVDFANVKEVDLNGKLVK